MAARCAREKTATRLKGVEANRGRGRDLRTLAPDRAMMRAQAEIRCGGARGGGRALRGRRSPCRAGAIQVQGQGHVSRGEVERIVNANAHADALDN